MGQILPTSPPHQEASIASTRCSAQPYELSFPTFWRSAQYTIQLVPSPSNSGPHSKCDMRVACSSIALLQGILVTNKPRHQSLAPARSSSQAALPWRALAYEHHIAPRKRASTAHVSYLRIGIQRTIPRRTLTCVEEHSEPLASILLYYKV